MDTKHVVDFLNDNSSDIDLLNRLQTPEQINDTDEFPPLFKIENSSCLPQLSWDDILQLAQTAYDIHSEHKHNILFLRSSREELPEHIHSYFEIIYVLSGTCVHSVNGNMETLQAGDLCILPPPHITCSLGIPAVSLRKFLSFPIILPVSVREYCKEPIHWEPF